MQGALLHLAVALLCARYSLVLSQRTTDVPSDSTPHDLYDYDDNSSGVGSGMEGSAEGAFPPYFGYVPLGIAPPADESSRKENGSMVLCGLPPFLNCRQENVTNASIPLSECETIGGTIGFVTAIVIGGTMMVVGNFLVPMVLIFQKTYRSRHNCIKGSLAIVDMLVGCYLLCCLLPSLFWIRGLTEESVLEYVLSSSNTALSVFLGSLLMLTTQLSTLHLLVLSAERFVAIKWPFWHRQLHTRTIWIPISAIWVLCILQACLPGMLNEYFAYQFNSLFLVYFLVVRRTDDGSNLHGTLYTVLTVVIPYLITVLLIISTAAIAWCHLRKSKKFTRGRNLLSTTTQTTYISTQVPPVSNERAQTGPIKVETVSKDRRNPEIAVLKTTALMIFAFSLSMIPVTVVYILHVHGYFGEDDCYQYALPTFTTFYITIANSLSNVIIYSFRDQKFREALKGWFGRIKK